MGQDGVRNHPPQSRNTAVTSYRQPISLSPSDWLRELIQLEPGASRAHSTMEETLSRKPLGDASTGCGCPTIWRHGSFDATACTGRATHALLVNSKVAEKLLRGKTL